MTRPARQLRDDLRSEIVDHCLAELPNEACGLLAVDRSAIVKVYPCRNADASPVAYTIEPADHHAALVDAESHGWKLGGVFHSHPKGKATMSATDLDKANEPDWLYVVVGLGGPLPELTVNSVT